MTNYDKSIELISKMKENKYDSRVDHFIKEIRTLNLPKSIRATRLILNEMTSEKGYKRHDGRDYFVHPIAIAQIALDFEIISRLIQDGDSRKADVILTTCLLHDILEDVPTITKDDLKKDYGTDVMVNVDNVSKRDREPFEEYIKRFSSNEISALVKILDRLHNVSTLDKSSLEHRKKQLLETRQVYLPLTKVYRRQYWEYGNFYFQARLIMTSILNVIEQLNIQEETVIELKEKLKHCK